MNSSIKIIITGDIHLGSGRTIDFEDNSSINLLFGNFLKQIKEADISITNLESPLINGGEPILKTGPNLKSPVKVSTVLKKAGFDLVTLANNHIMDYGREGIVSTLETCSNVGISTVGADINFDEACKPYIEKINGTKIGIINFTENEFSTTTDDSPGAHPLNPVQNYYRIKELKNIADYVFVIVHGGHEGYQLPSPRMKETYRFFIDAGAAAVIGHHPHCYSGHEVYKGAPIFYSIGNFLFDKEGTNESDWNKGFMVEFTINQELSFKMIPYIQNGISMGLRKLREEEYQKFEKNIEQLNDIISEDEKLSRKFEELCESSADLYNAYIEPYSNKYLHLLKRQKLFPSLLSKRKKRLLLNLIRCESHRDILQIILQKWK